MIVSFWIEIALIVVAINGPRDKVHIRFVFRGRTFAFRCILLALLLLDVLRCCRAQKNQALAIGRPDRACRTLGEIGYSASFAAIQGQQSDLRWTRLSFAVFFPRPNEGDGSSVWSPARAGIVLAVCESHG